jgi:hypothetical protein
MSISIATRGYIAPAAEVSGISDAITVTVAAVEDISVTVDTEDITVTVTVE